MITKTTFDEYFDSGKDDNLSPFLTPGSKKFAKNAYLKVSLLAACLLTLSLILAFFTQEQVISQILIVIVFFLVGTPAVIASFKEFMTFRVNIQILMTVAAFVSLAIGSGHEGALLLVLFALSEAIEELVTHKTKDALGALNKLAPTTCHKVEADQTWSETKLDDLQVGDHIFVQAGEMIPIDGVVKEGSSYINMIHLTGESVPVAKGVDDEVNAGSTNIDGGLKIEVTKRSSESTLAKMVQLITEAQSNKPEIQTLLDRFGRPYSMTIMLASFGFMGLLTWGFNIPFFGHEGALYRSLAFLIAASPCALIIATPTAYFSALSSCAKKGILLKGGVMLDALASCKAIAFDKTGTLTEGVLKFNSLIPNEKSDLSDNLVISIAKAVEKHVTHPIAKAILAIEQNDLPVTIKDLKAVSGQGIQATVEHENKAYTIKIGRSSFVFEKEKQPLFKVKDKQDGIIHAYMKIDQHSFLLTFEDTLRSNIADSLKRLKDHYNVKLIMLTGDKKENAEHIQQMLPLDEVYAELKPEEKLSIIQEISEKAPLAMIGDGMNDAPALARAHVGISMGQIGSSTAIDASDIVFVKDDLQQLDWLYRKAKNTVSIVIQNFTLAVGVIGLATSPALLGYIPLWLAVVLHEGGTILVGLNSLRLLKKS